MNVRPFVVVPGIRKLYGASTGCTWYVHDDVPLQERPVNVPFSPRMYVVPVPSTVMVIVCAGGGFGSS